MESAIVQRWFADSENMGTQRHSMKLSSYKIVFGTSGLWFKPWEQSAPSALSTCCARLRCQGSSNHLLHKPHQLHCWRETERFYDYCFSFYELLNVLVVLVKFNCTVICWMVDVCCTLDRLFLLKFLILAIYFDCNSTALPEWLCNELTARMNFMSV